MIGTLDTSRREVTIVGAGIAGMLAAYALDKSGYEVTLLEEQERSGGLLQTVHTAYGMAERAAHSLLASSAVVDLCRELGVELAEIRPDSRARFIVRDGRLRKFPLSFTETISTLKHAAFARTVAGYGSLDLDRWGRTHLGDAAVEYLLTPFVRGIYGVQPGDLGVEAAFPSLSVAPGRTLVGTMLGKALHRHAKNGANNGHANGNRKPCGIERKGKESKRMVAPRCGIADLTTKLEKRLEEKLAGRFRRGARVEHLPNAPNVVIATPAYAAAKLLEPVAPVLSNALRDVKYTPIVSVTAFVPRESFTRPVKGVGALIPAKEKRKSLGILFTSSSFEGRVLDESRYASFTVLLGGSLQPGWINATDSEIGDAVREELKTLLGIRGEPSELVISRWPRAIPQYSTSLPFIWQTARETWCSPPGHLLFGNYTGQVSLRGMIENASAIN